MLGLQVVEAQRIERPRKASLERERLLVLHFGFRRPAYLDSGSLQVAFLGEQQERLVNREIVYDAGES